MNGKQFARFLDRDQYCLHCGETEALAPNHRVNRGMGGSKKRDHPANIVVLCSVFNGLIEADAKAAQLASINLWKLHPWDDPLFLPVFDVVSGVWWRLDDQFGRWPVEWDDRPF